MREHPDLDIAVAFLVTQRAFKARKQSERQRLTRLALELIAHLGNT